MSIVPLLVFTRIFNSNALYVSNNLYNYYVSFVVKGTPNLVNARFVRVGLIVWVRAGKVKTFQIFLRTCLLLNEVPLKIGKYTRPVVFTKCDSLFIYFK